jgi:hypothetical protein
MNSKLLMFTLAMAGWFVLGALAATSLMTHLGSTGNLALNHSCQPPFRT